MDKIDEFIKNLREEIKEILHPKTDIADKREKIILDSLSAIIENGIIAIGNTIGKNNDIDTYKKEREKIVKLKKLYAKTKKWFEENKCELSFEVNRNTQK